jgi:hypothetical protein
MKIKKLYATTDHRSVLNKVYKVFITQKEGICNFDPYHSGENANRKRRDRRNWKRYRKTQWRDKE